MIFQEMEVSATTLWEIWDSPSEGPSMNSRNHIMFGSVGAWFYKYLAGIRQLAVGEVTSGYQNVLIRPPPTSALLYESVTSVNASLNWGGAGLGTVSVEWSREGGNICG
jgi:alpha-L-rhamnosidase